MSLFSDKATHGVEYQVKPHIAWHEASLVDLTQDAKGAFQLHLTFVDDVWNPCVADPACVRNSSPPHEGNIRLEIKMRVEVWIPKTESKPASWNPATVDKVKEEFVYVTLDASRSSLIVELSHVRLPSTEITYADLTDNVSRNTIPLQKSIGSWATSDDALGCFSHICSKTGLLSMAPNPKDVKEIVLLGTDAAIRKATMLLDIHLKHQTKIADFQNSRMRQLDQLAGLKAKVENMQSVDVLVPQDSIPKIIGTSGANIKKIQDKYKVSIRILDEHIVHDRGPNGQLMKCVRILGKSMDDCVAAKSEVEYIEVRIPILEDQFGWLLGAKGVTIREFKDKSGVQTLTLERNKETILLYGSRPSVEDAQAMIDAHMLYFPVFNQMGEEIQQLNTTMDSLQYRTGGSAYGSRRDDRKGRGKERGKDWGKDWGWESDGGKPSSATQGKGKKSDYDFDDKGKKGKKSKDGKEGKDGKYSKDGKDGKGEKDDKDGKGKKGEQ
eukprot:GEMP01012855.1.p1 GENE.GEMP01012855.1~~GEMP01012855.1.p1  ORF type:complete len:496 (+),score=100.11 GEMP01012855.1:78-1565(+)